jgi:hypothetical protein
MCIIAIEQRVAKVVEERQFASNHRRGVFLRIVFPSLVFRPHLRRHLFDVPE